MAKGRSKDFIQVAPMVRRAFVGALKDMKKKELDETKGRQVLSRLLKGWLEDEDPKVAMSAVKLVMEKDVRHSGSVEHKHAGLLSETEIVEKLLTRSQHLSDEDFVRLAAGLREMGADSGATDESTRH